MYFGVSNSMMNSETTKRITIKNFNLLFVAYDTECDGSQDYRWLFKWFQLKSDVRMQFKTTNTDVSM